MKPLCNLHFADDINFMADSNIDLPDLTNKLVERVGAYEIALSTEKSKVVVISTSNTSVSVTILLY